MGWGGARWPSPPAVGESGQGLGPGAPGGGRFIIPGRGQGGGSSPKAPAAPGGSSIRRRRAAAAAPAHPAAAPHPHRQPAPGPGFHAGAPPARPMARFPDNQIAARYALPHTGTKSSNMLIIRPAPPPAHTRQSPANYGSPTVTASKASHYCAASVSAASGAIPGIPPAARPRAAADPWTPPPPARQATRTARRITSRGAKIHALVPPDGISAQPVGSRHDPHRIPSAGPGAKLAMALGSSRQASTPRRW